MDESCRGITPRLIRIVGGQGRTCQEINGKQREELSLDHTKLKEGVPPSIETLVPYLRGVPPIRSRTFCPVEIILVTAGAVKLLLSLCFQRISMIKLPSVSTKWGEPL